MKAIEAASKNKQNNQTPQNPLERPRKFPRKKQKISKHNKCCCERKQNQKKYTSMALTLILLANRPNVNDLQNPNVNDLQKPHFTHDCCRPSKKLLRTNVCFGRDNWSSVCSLNKLSIAIYLVSLSSTCFDRCFAIIIHYYSTMLFRLISPWFHSLSIVLQWPVFGQNGGLMIWWFDGSRSEDVLEILIWVQLLCFFCKRKRFVFQDLNSGLVMPPPENVEEEIFWDASETIVVKQRGAESVYAQGRSLVNISLHSRF